MRTTIKILLTLFISTTMNAQTTSILEKVNNDRQFFETLGNIYPISKNVKISDTQIANVKCYWIEPKTEKDDNITVYLHGGSFALGSIKSHKAMVSHIAETTKSKILFIEYSLAPENPFPVAINEIVNVYKALVKNYPESEINFMGDSAGGGLAVSSIHSIIENKLHLPSSVILLSPWINLKCNTNSYKTRQKIDPILTKQNLLEYAKYYMAGSTDADPSELVFENFPPVFVMVGSNEILFCDAKNFYDYIKKVQPNAFFKEYENQTHVWLLTNISSEKSKETLNDISEFVNNY